MSTLLNSRPAGAERMPNRIDEVLLDPGNESVPNPGEAAKLFTALPEEIKLAGACLSGDGTIVVPRSSPRQAQASLPRLPLLHERAIVE